MKKNLANKLATALGKTKNMLTGAAMTAATAVPGIVNAAGNDPGALVNGILDVVVGIFPFIGAFFVVAGVFKLIMAYRNDQPEAQTSAAKDIVIGAVFIVFRVFVWQAVKGFISF